MKWEVIEGDDFKLLRKKLIESFKAPNQKVINKYFFLDNSTKKVSESFLMKNDYHRDSKIYIYRFSDKKIIRTTYQSWLNFFAFLSTLAIAIILCGCIICV